ncbi:hypothetical protein B2G71_20590 [Novosphingobium sp. PC22D]|uniref:TadE/TadG family type IV pilus assembly protein n=1 Tax=Novosphingobium sp. PC22D TaxID=1962403 RepID=UPI000BFADDD2|nr:TadE/TadG family type IV pilus assembly protein [Novosphingobium sp. PC22D]PEQ10720.1 hypothetical protein B2G71_20590 [Novosphingobium sp. PC22D]
MRLWARLAGDREGATLVEFALVAPVFVAMLFGVIESGRLFWVKQTLDEVAYSTARCMSVSSTCDDETKREDFAVDRAAALGITIALEEISTDTDVTCKSVAGSNEVRIDHPVTSAMTGLIPVLPQSLSAEACFPKLG